MTERTNITLVVPDDVFARMRAIPELAEVIDPDHGPYDLMGAMRALRDGSLFVAADEAVNAALDCIPVELRGPGK